MSAQVPLSCWARTRLKPGCLCLAAHVRDAARVRDERSRLPSHAAAAFTLNCRAFAPSFDPSQTLPAADFYLRYSFNTTSAGSYRKQRVSVHPDRLVPESADCRFLVAVKVSSKPNTAEALGDPIAGSARAHRAVLQQQTTPKPWWRSAADISRLAYHIAVGCGQASLVKQDCLLSSNTACENASTPVHEHLLGGTLHVETGIICYRIGYRQAQASLVYAGSPAIIEWSLEPIHIHARGHSDGSKV